MRCREQKSKKERIREYLEKHSDESGIIYCATRKNVDELYLFLESAGFSVGRYHAGMGNEARKSSQEDFIYDRIQVMIATNAFGMGIDKSNVRYVLHYNMPQSLVKLLSGSGKSRTGFGAVRMHHLLFASGRRYQSVSAGKQGKLWRIHSGRDAEYPGAGSGAASEDDNLLYDYGMPAKLYSRLLLGNRQKSSVETAPTVWRNWKRWMQQKRQQM